MSILQGGTIGAPRSSSPLPVWKAGAKPSREPIFQVGTGQSNYGGFNLIVDADQTINPRVFDWQAPVSDPTNYRWVVADPARTSNFVGGSLFVGMRGGSHGHIGWACANKLQKETGRDVYMLNVGKGGVASSDWQDGGAISNALTTQAAAAMAAAGISKIDVLIWLQGETDFSAGSPPESFAARVAGILGTDAVSNGWATADYTHNIICDIGDSWGEWAGLYSVARRLSPRSSFVNTENLPEISGHYSGDASHFIGLMAANKVLQGPDSFEPKTKTQGHNFLVGSTTGTAVFNIESGGIGPGEALVYAINDDNDKVFFAKVVWWYQNGTNMGYEVISTGGESGFSFNQTNFGGFFGVFSVNGTAGETWHWSINKTYTPTVYSGYVAE